MFFKLFKNIKISKPNIITLERLVLLSTNVEINNNINSLLFTRSYFLIFLHINLYIV